MQFIVELTAYALMLWVLPYLVLYVFNNPVPDSGAFSILNQLIADAKIKPYMKDGL